MMDNGHGTISAMQVRDLRVPHGSLAVWALGQQGYLFKGGNHVLVIDPYLSNSVEEQAGDASGSLARLVPIPIRPEELSMVTLVLVSHHHADHADPETLRLLLAAAPGARFMSSYKARDELHAFGVDVRRAEVPRVDQRVRIGDGCWVTAIPSAHYEQEPDAAGNPAYLGFVIELNGVVVYHSGDSIVYPGLIERLSAQPIDLMCVPINGRDWFREQQEIVGNFDYREAAELTAAVAARVLIPGHNDMFAVNRINPAYLLDYLQAHHPGQRFKFMQSGELYYYVS